MEGETYHVFNRGAHKQAIFLDESDYRRFQILLLLANSAERIDVGNVLSKYQGRPLEEQSEIFDTHEPKQSLVEILAYALLPNHFHVVLRQVAEGGISKYMLKVSTGYSMYFNLKRQHSGTIFQGRYKSNHIDSDPYATWIFAYVHLNPMALVAPDWSERGISDMRKAREHLNTYKYSSYIDYYGTRRPENAILSLGAGKAYVEQKRDIESLLTSYQKGNTAHGL